ncbi:MAG: hypothetical protein J6C37_02720 [Roseburia sp.]|nr:hypothetical protein [Roseburia sp.]
MKNAVMIFVNVIFWVFTLVIAMAISGRMNRSVELQSNLSTAVETAISQMTVEETASGMTIEEELQSDEEMVIAECIEYLVTALDTDSDVQVDVMQSDTKKGVLAIRVTENFKHPNRKDGTVRCDRIAIWDRTSETEAEQYEVKFYRTKADMVSEENCYKAYTVREGDRIAAPATPGEEGAVFLGWRDSNDYVADFSEPVEQNQAYYAEW